MKTLLALLKSKTLYISLAGLITAGIIIALLMDFVIMPNYTNYNEGVTVPDVTKLSLEEAENLLTTYGLRFEIHDRRAHSAYPANYIIDQSPSAKQLVKPNRKVYLTVNSESTPQVVVPKVENLSFRNARLQLENNGLTVGSISYESNRFRNTILRQSIAPEDTVDRGTVVNLVVSDGLGARMVEMPDVEGLRLSEAQQKIMAAGLRVGELRFEPARDVTPNTVLSYSPVGPELQEGESIELVIAERFDAREEAESGAVVDDSTATTPPDTTQIDN
ncbi:PASTA domain-containing protein [Rhodohalobacter sp.]|uniref:PASTA domain-containing protein n=1 Tax=Rhodohalobacter sp. TaxID=1974210 RepID=UPI0035671E96